MSKLGIRVLIDSLVETFGDAILVGTVTVGRDLMNPFSL